MRWYRLCIRCITLPPQIMYGWLIWWSTAKRRDASRFWCCKHYWLIMDEARFIIYCNIFRNIEKGFLSPPHTHIMVLCVYLCEWFEWSQFIAPHSVDTHTYYQYTHQIMRSFWMCYVLEPEYYVFGLFVQLHVHGTHACVYTRMLASIARKLSHTHTHAKTDPYGMLSVSFDV